MDSQDYLEITVTAPDEEAGDIIVAMVSELSYDSFVYEDGVQKCYIQRQLFDEDALCMALGEAVECIGGTLEYEAKPMPKVDWNSEWEKTGFTPIECRDFVVLPYDGTFYECSLSPIYINPQMAFGSGHHQTTYMMMETLQDFAQQLCGASVMDLGCGTAVLAILAAKLGATDVTGIDIDAVAVRSSIENVRLNGYDFPVLCGDDTASSKDAYDFFLANIHKNIIIEGLPRYAEYVRKGGKLLVSGFFEDEASEIVEAAASNGFALYEWPDTKIKAIRSTDGWCCITFIKL